MRLQSRLTITAAVLITAVSLAVGGASTFGSYQHELDVAKQQLVADNKQITAAVGQELSTALLLSFQQDMTIGLIDSTKTLSLIKDGDIPLTKKPAAKQLFAAQKMPSLRQSAAGQPYLLETVALSNNEWVVLQLSVANAKARLMAALTSLIFYTVAADLLAVFLVWFLIRRDLWQIRRLIDSAKKIAAGGSVEFAGGKGAAEVEQLAWALQQMVLQLRANELEMQRFMGDASHELRTPLTVIRGYLEMLSRPEPVSAEFGSRAVAKMTSEVSRMQSLIEDLLLLAELGAAGRPLTLEPVDLAALVSGEAQSLKDLQPGRNVNVNFVAGLAGASGGGEAGTSGSAEGDGHGRNDGIGAEAIIQADTGLISQLLANLFSNIRRHTSSATAVEVQLEAVSLGWQLTVDDAGPGLTAAAYARGIGHFERFDVSRSRENGGSGLGMSIMAGIVARHNGQMWLEPSPLGGLRTRIWLPSQQN